MNPPIRASEAKKVLELAGKATQEFWIPEKIGSFTDCRVYSFNFLPYDFGDEGKEYLHVREVTKGVDPAFITRLVHSYLEAVGVIEFYGCPSNWKSKSAYSRECERILDDCAPLMNYTIAPGGKRAREFLRRMEGE